VTLAKVTASATTVPVVTLICCPVKATSGATSTSPVAAVNSFPDTGTLAIPPTITVPGAGVTNPKPEGEAIVRALD
jgi:hypothetical protein